MSAELNARYVVASRDAQRDARGERASSYTTKFEVWGEPMREGAVGADSELGGIRSEATFRLRVRWRPNWWTAFVVGDRLTDRETGQVAYLSAPPTVIGNKERLQLIVTQSPVPST